MSSRPADNKQLVAGSIRLLDLDALKRELGGDEWQRASNAAYNLIEDCIRGKLEAGDTYVKQGDMFVLCFACPDRQAVEARMRAIVKDIKDLLTNLAAPFRIGHEVTDVVFVDAPEESILDVIAASLRQVREDAEDAARKWREHLRKNANVQYRPVWSPARKLVAVHRASLDEETAQRCLEKLNSLSSADEMLSVLFDLDCLVLGRAVSSLHRLVTIGGRTQLILPVNFNSINVAGRRKSYLDLCEDYPAAYRRFLLFEIRNIPSGTPSARILELASCLTRFAHGALIEISPSWRSYLPVGSGSGIMGAATDADQLSAAGANMNTELQRFAAETRSRNLKSFLHGARTQDHVRAAAASGIDFVDGASVAHFARELKTTYSWEAKYALPKPVAMTSGP